MSGGQKFFFTAMGGGGGFLQNMKGKILKIIIAPSA